MASNVLQSRSRYVCFTFNNPTDVEVDAIKEMLSTKCDYAVYGVERGESGTLHLQGYMEVKREARARLLTVSRWFPRQAHVEARKGSRMQCVMYCMKGEQSHEEWSTDGVDGINYGANADVWEHGERPPDDKTQGKRTDIEKVRDSILCGDIKNEFDLLMQCRSMQAVNFGRQFLNNMPVEVVRPRPIVYWLFGPTGTGKSYGCAELIKRLGEHREWTFWRTNGGFKWFDGYNRQEIAWFDDFRFDGRPTDFAFLLNLLDVYPLRVPIKGGFVTWDPKIILFTGPLSVEESFESLGGREDIGQFQRRVTRSFDFAGAGAVELSCCIFSYLNNPEPGQPRQRWSEIMDFEDDSADVSFEIEEEEEEDPPAMVREVAEAAMESEEEAKDGWEPPRLRIRADEEHNRWVFSEDDMEDDVDNVLMHHGVDGVVNDHHNARVRGFFEQEAEDAGDEYVSSDDDFEV